MTHPLTTAAQVRHMAQIKPHAGVELAAHVMATAPDYPLPERRARFVTALRHLPLTIAAELIRKACEATGGSWQQPTPADTAQDGKRPVTHMFEIHLMEVQGAGLTVEEAARSWIMAAQNIGHGDTGQ